MGIPRPVARLLPCLLLLCATLCAAVPARAQDAPLVPGAQTATMAPDSQSVLVPLTGVAAVNGGESHTCALTNAGGVKCWGDDDLGQVGDGTDSNAKVTPVDVVGLTSGAQAVAAGRTHSCALTAAGGVKCWGEDIYGEAGDGPDNSLKFVPVAVSGLASGVKAIDTGSDYSCALTTGGGVKCWGYDGSGQLGNGADASNKSTPVDVANLSSGVKAIATGYFHTCALTTAGGVKCWGWDQDGQVGDGANSSNKLVPVDVSGLTNGVKAIATGDNHTCALTTGGGVKCWGSDSDGQIGDGVNASNKLVPAQVVGLESGVAAIAAGAYHTCALTTTGGVKCWGYDALGQVGDGDDADGKITPVDVVGLTSGVKAIAAGGYHTCAVTVAGGLKCWGLSDRGQVGDGKKVSRPTPSVVQEQLTCFKLTRNKSGSGGTPVASPLQSTNCPQEHYLTGSQIMLTAAPANGWAIAGWSGTSNDSSTAMTNTVAMGTVDAAVSVTYAPAGTDGTKLYLPAVRR